MLACLKIAQENERFAILTFGRFDRLVGPGLVFAWPFGGSRFVRIASGQKAPVIGEGFIEVDGNSVPCISNATLDIGGVVRVIGFGNNQVKVEPIQSTYVCERCGHENHV